MKRFALVLLGVVLMAGLTACGKQPVEEINATRAALDAAVSEGAEKYTAEDLRLVSDAMAAAMDEVKVQDGKMFKNYDQAKAQLAKVKAEAETLQAKVLTVKEELRAAAASALNEANAAVAEARGQVENAPAGKGSAADIEMMKADVQGLEAALAEIQPLIDSGEFAIAAEKAVTIRGKAQGIAEEVRIAREKLAVQPVARRK